jgi:hypothetical protein
MYSKAGWSICQNKLEVTHAPTSFPTILYDPQNCDALHITGLTKEGILVPRNPEGCMGTWYNEKKDVLRSLYEANLRTKLTKPIYTREFKDVGKCGKLERHAFCANFADNLCA